tara:strand:- start:36 stop:1745 length:1710 start_codon:yes stop_codon:yes gene_type:complete
MSKSLYEEAIADARQLREMAEQNAKNQIIEAITPKIQQLIEKQLVGEGLEAEELDDEALASLLPGDIEIVDDEGAGDVAVLDLDAMAFPPASEEFPSPEGTTISVDADAGVDIDVAGDGSIGIAADGVEINVNGESDMLDDEIEDEDLLLSKESVRALVNLIHGTKGRKKINEMKKQLSTLHRRVRRFAAILEGANLNQLTSSQRKLACKHYRNLLRETITLRDQVILTEGESEFKGLQKQTDQIIKEIRKMSRRRNSKILNRIFETADEKSKEELDELDAILTLEPADEDEAAEVEDLLADLEIDVNLEEPVETVETGEEEEVEVEEEEGGEEEEVELELEYGAVGETYEIDEGMLRRELRRMRRLREQEESDAVDASPAPGGLDGEVVEVDDEDLLNALADELGDPGVPEPTVESRRRAKRVAEVRRRRAARAHRTNESRKTRALQKKLVEYKKAVTSLRDQLIEMNLFNAKLLYANKLMQNRNVTSKQQRAIVEALDNAKTLREAKLLYKSLTTSLNKRSGRTLSEGRIAKTLGSSSRSTRSANPVNNGNEVDRWAVLAGIANKDN